jgi:tetratricopeptide (TPR) repeat protein
MRNRSSQTCAVGRVSGVVLASLFGFYYQVAHADEIARGDSAWARRAEGELEGRPLPGPIREAVSSYEDALSARPESLEARWKLLRALQSGRIFDRAREVSDQGLDLLAGGVGSGVRLDEMDPEEIRNRLAAADVSQRAVARLYFWSAINWGAWSRRAGLLSAVRRGVANRIHRYALITVALEPEYDEGGAFRLLGRLHASLPRVPFVSGWVDRQQSIPLLERAFAIAPANPGNRLLLAITLLDLAPERSSEALELLKQVERLTPRTSMRIEDLAMRREARERLSEGHAGATI